MVRKVDSNFTGLRYAMEVEGQPGVLPGEDANPGSPVWKELEPNSYNDFGADITTTARSPITAGRQKKKGRVTDLDAKGGFQMDFTGNNMVEPFSTFMFADWRKTPEALEIVSTNSGTKKYAKEGAFSDPNYAAGALVLASGFANAGNNGIKLLTAATDDDITVTETVVTETGAVDGSLFGWTLSITIEADADNAYGTDKTVSYTFDVGDTVDDAGAALVTLLAAQTPAITATYTSGTDVLQIASGENAGESVITAVVTDQNGFVQTTAVPTVEVPAMSTMATRDIDLTNIAPPDVIANTEIKFVGVESATGDIDVDASDPLLPALTSTTLDFTDLPLLAGKWVYVGGDSATNRFTNAGNNGFARVHSIAAGRLVFDKTQNTMVTEANTTKKVRLYIGDLIKNENDPDLIKIKTMQFERKVVVGYEYLLGSHGNELTINMGTAEKITVDMTFVSFDAAPQESRKTGSFPDILTDAEAFNTTSDMVRIRASEQGSASPLFGYIQDMNLKINNNVTPLKALGVLGAFDASIGDFEVTGDITAYFNDIAAVQAVRNSDSLTLDFVLGFDNRGWVFDVPLFTGSKGILSVEKDKPITIPVGMEAAEDTTLHTTLIACWFPYLPDVATA